MFRAERRWQYSVRHFLTGIQDRNVALCRLDLYYVKLVRAILRRVPTRADLPSSSKVVSFCTLFGCGGLPAKAFLFCPMAQLSHPNNISLRIEKRQWTGLFKNVPKSPGNLADIKNFAEAVRDPPRSGLARPQELFRRLFLSRILHSKSRRRNVVRFARGVQEKEGPLSLRAQLTVNKLSIHQFRTMSDYGGDHDEET